MDALTAAPARIDARQAVFESPTVDFVEIIATLRRHVRLFIGVVLTVFVIVAFVTTSATPRYTASTTILINQHAPDVLHLNDMTPQDAVEQQLNAADSAAVDTQVEILKSRALASQVVDQLHLDHDPEFNAALRSPGRFAFLGSIGGLFQSRTPAEFTDPTLSKEREYQAVVSQVIQDLDVKRTGLTYTIELNFKALSPLKAQTIANAFTQKYLTEGLDAKLDLTNTATSWLDTRLNQLRDEVQKADAAVEQYKIANNLLSAAGATLTEQEITNVDTQLAQSRAQAAEQDALLSTAQRQLAAGSNGGDIAAALNNPVIGSLRAQRATASALLANLQARYGDKYPDVLKAKQALADLDGQIQAEITRVISSLKAQSQVEHTRTAALAAAVNQTRGSLANNNRALVRLNDLQNADDAAKTVYVAFLSRYKEALAKEGVQAPDARIVSPAKLPTSPSSPNKRLDTAIAIVLGLMAGVGAVWIADLLRRGVAGAGDVEEAFGLPCLGEVPTLASTLDGGFGFRAPMDPVRYVVEKPLSRFAEAFRNLRTSVLSSKTGAPVKVIAVTSSLPGEGKTTTSLCLARTMALSGYSVVVVDCDLRQRSINRAFKVEPTQGLLEVLNGAPLDDVLMKDGPSGAFVLPLAKSAFTPRDVFGTPAMAQLLTQLRARFDVVILDTAPVLAVADTRVLCPQADAVLFLTRWRKTSRKAVASAIRALNPDDTFVAGIALTQVNIREQALAGEGASHYYRAYRKYYTG